MCLNPLLIKNPYYGPANKFKGPYDFLHDTTNEYIQVPCGKCPECLSLKQNYLSQRCELLSRTHYVFYQTLTYQNSMLPVESVVDPVSGREYTFKFPDCRDFQNYVKRLRKEDFFGAPFKYLCCSEYGGKFHRPHFHVLYFVPKSRFRSSQEAMSLSYRWHYELFNRWNRNVGSTRNPIYMPLSRYVRKKGRCTYDFHYVEPRRTERGVIDVCYYVTKYVLKFDEWLEKRRVALKINYDPETYNLIWSRLKNRVLISKHFGDDVQFTADVRRGILFSLEHENRFPIFVLNSGRTYPLAPYLRKKFMTLDDAIQFYLIKCKLDGCLDSSVPYQGYDPASYPHRLDRGLSILRKASLRNCDEFFLDSE